MLKTTQGCVSHISPICQDISELAGELVELDFTKQSSSTHPQSHPQSCSTQCSCEEPPRPSYDEQSSAPLSSAPSPSPPDAVGPQWHRGPTVVERERHTNTIRSQVPARACRPEQTDHPPLRCGKSPAMIAEKGNGTDKSIQKSRTSTTSCPPARSQAQSPPISNKRQVSSVSKS